MGITTETAMPERTSTTLEACRQESYKVHLQHRLLRGKSATLGLFAHKLSQTSHQGLKGNCVNSCSSRSVRVGSPGCSSHAADAQRSPELPAHTQQVASLPPQSKLRQQKVQYQSSAVLVPNVSVPKGLCLGLRAHN